MELWGIREVAPEYYPDQHHDGASEPGDQRSCDISAQTYAHDPVDDWRSYEPGEEAQGISEQPESDEYCFSTHCWITKLRYGPKAVNATRVESLY
jgi:hypothetical protein